MKRASLFLLTSLGAIACCAQAVALGVSSSSASTGVNARIVARPVGIQVVSPLVLPSVTASAVSPNASFAGGRAFGGN
ncbi:hypothetical protein [Phenylobacterium sp. J367]|uniref:hypothetical protein n=1 Tax=Phenylobacterium sp. J367 TaxID=2898435 RepID=UPI0021507DED|nr:hypothetical protein [Phenylobacterium sp. J367]MCR5880542.1 hypothetical protein [Phenylobacterium sp. J367]